jgi:hypothetical protein
LVLARFEPFSSDFLLARRRKPREKKASLAASAPHFPSRVGGDFP